MQSFPDVNGNDVEWSTGGEVTLQKWASYEEANRMAYTTEMSAGKSGDSKKGKTSDNPPKTFLLTQSAKTYAVHPSQAVPGPPVVGRKSWSSRECPPHKKPRLF
jgi:hypothetical protein